MALLFAPTPSGAARVLFGPRGTSRAVTFGLAPSSRIYGSSPHLAQAMPMLILGLATLTWIIVRWLVLRRDRGKAGAMARRDLWVGLALAAWWFAVWGRTSASITTMGAAMHP